MADQENLPFTGDDYYYDENGKIHPHDAMYARILGDLMIKHPTTAMIELRIMAKKMHRDQRLKALEEPKPDLSVPRSYGDDREL